MNLRSAVAILRTIENVRSIKETQEIAEGLLSVDCDPVLLRTFRSMLERKAEEIRTGGK